MNQITGTIVQNGGNWASVEGLRGILPPQFITKLKVKILYDFDWEECFEMKNDLFYYKYYLFNETAKDFKKENV